MVSDTQTMRSILIETKLMREQAGLMLERLLETRMFIETRIEQSGRHDPMKSVTGHSAFDHAISSTRHFIGRMDELLQDGAVRNGVNPPVDPRPSPRAAIATE